MSKIDEAKLNQAMKTISDSFQKIADASMNCHTDLTKLFEVPVASPESIGNTPNFWTKTQGQKGEFELLKFMDTEEYRMLRAEVQDKDHPLFHEFGGNNYTIWLMRDGETIGRKPLKAKGEGKT